jgi:hypothetical protein
MVFAKLGTSRKLPRKLCTRETVVDVNVAAVPIYWSLIISFHSLAEEVAITLIFSCYAEDVTEVSRIVATAKYIKIRLGIIAVMMDQKTKDHRVPSNHLGLQNNVRQLQKKEHNAGI